MGIRDEELSRLKKYAHALGTKITFKPYVPHSGDAASWVLSDNGEIELIIYTASSTSKTELIIAIVHELAHQLSYIYQGRKLDETLNVVLEKEDHEVTKSERKRIYEMEVADALYQENIWNELNIKIPMYKLKASLAFDEWIYRKFYEDGVFPPKKERTEIKRSFLEKFKQQS